MEYHIVIAALSLVLPGACVGESILPASLSGAVGGAVRFITTLQPPTQPFASISWRFKGIEFIKYTLTNEIINEAYAPRVSLDKSTGSLELRDLVLADSGVYSIRIVPNLRRETMSSDVNLNIYVPITEASITNTASAASLVAGVSAATLTCDAAAGTVSAREWLRSGRPLLPSPERVTMSTDARFLSINPVLSGDHGNYQCRVSNPVTAMTAAYFLTVNFGPQNVSIAGPREAPLGHRVLLRCRADSVPPPTYSWTLNGNETRVINSTYVIERMEERHAGNYTCTVNNHVTKLENSTLVNLRASASAPYWSFALLMVVALNMGECRQMC